MRSLDKYQDYLSKQEQKANVVVSAAAVTAAIVAPETTVPAQKGRASDKAPQTTRYVMRGGVTVPRDLPLSHTPTEKIPLPNAEEMVQPSAPLGADESGAMWARLPRHIQLLASIPAPQEEEVAQKYYTRGFKESREQLIKRLLDPPLTLEETARVLGVCPATVRRYTNRGVLPHQRTVGQQRRFRLSDVLVFLEQQEKTRTSKPVLASVE